MRSGSRPLEGEVGFRTFDVTRARKYGRSIPRSKVLRFLKLVKNVKKLSNTHADMINHRSIYAEVGNSKFIENFDRNCEICVKILSNGSSTSLR